MLPVTGAKVVDVEKLAGKKVEATATIKDNKEIVVSAVVEKILLAPVEILEISKEGSVIFPSSSISPMAQAPASRALRKPATASRCPG
ncbi:MAG TPA: hypothetical protein PLI09_12950 [Candidatus Hydrogenedentes bacterium]|nr:hypothetical protein [Candidatus Hydrogenedentota bacterium]